MNDNGQTFSASPVEAKMRGKRRGPRMNSQVPVSIEWREQAINRTNRAQAHTRVVNFYGCLLVAAKPMPMEQKMTITNLANQRSIAAVVVYRGSKGLDGWEMGVELVKPEMDFWGIEL
jgi:hypothetical protein